LRHENKKGKIMDIRENVNIINGQLNQHMTGNTNMNIIGGWRSVTNDGTGTVAGNGGYRKDYCTKTQVPRGFDVGNVYLAWVEAPGARGQYEGEWRVGCSPKDGQGNWSYVQCELNIGSFVDAGYNDTINGNHATGGILIGATVPGAFGPPGSSKTATFAVATAGAPNNPSYAQFYNGLLINPDSIAKGGRGVQFGGANLAENAPYAPFEVTRSWETGIRLEKANFRDGNAITLSAQQKIAWDDGTQAVHLTPTEIRKLKRLLSKRKTT
jgi:hypothetical protein